MVENAEKKDCFFTVLTMLPTLTPAGLGDKEYVTDALEFAENEVIEISNSDQNTDTDPEFIPGSNEEQESKEESEAKAEPESKEESLLVNEDESEENEGPLSVPFIWTIDIEKINALSNYISLSWAAQIVLPEARTDCTVYTRIFRKKDDSEYVQLKPETNKVEIDPESFSLQGTGVINESFSDYTGSANHIYQYKIDYFFESNGQPSSNSYCSSETIFLSSAIAFPYSFS